MAKERHTPQRSCVACGQKLDKQALIRLVRTPQGSVQVDRTGKRAGRGAYLCSSSACWERAMNKGALERSLKMTFSAPDMAELRSYYQGAIASPVSGEH